MLKDMILKISTGAIIAIGVLLLICTSPFWLLGTKLMLGFVSSQIESIPRKNETMITASVSEIETESLSPEFDLYTVYVSFQYKDYTYENMFLEESTRQRNIGDELSIGVRAIESENLKPDLEIRNLRRTAADKASNRTMLLLALSLLIFGFLPVIAYIATFLDARRKKKVKIYTGVIRRCDFDHADANGRDVNSYDIAYTIAGRLYRVNVLGSYGNLPEGHLVHVYARPDRPQQGEVNFREILPPTEDEVSGAEVSALLAAEIPNEEHEVLKSKASGLFVFGIVTAIGLLMLIPSCVLLISLGEWIGGCIVGLLVTAIGVGGLIATLTKK